MKHFLYFITACLGIVMLFSACEKDDQVTTIMHGEPCIEPEQSIHEMQDWYYFKTGTYWVYKEQYSGLIDTISVYDHYAGVEYSYWFVFEAISSLDNFRYTYRVDSTFSRACWNVPNCICHKVFRSKWRPDDTNWVGEINAFFYPNYVDNYLHSEIGAKATILTHIYNKLKFNSFYFTDVLEWNLQYDDSEDDARTCYLIARNVGIIQKINYDLHEDWRLIDYHVIQ